VWAGPPRLARRSEGCRVAEDERDIDAHAFGDAFETWNDDAALTVFELHPLDRDAGLRFVRTVVPAQKVQSTDGFCAGATPQGRTTTTA
jgi:hypothetical protein